MAATLTRRIPEQLKRLAKTSRQMAASSPEEESLLGVGSSFGSVGRGATGSGS